MLDTGDLHYDILYTRSQILVVIMTVMEFCKLQLLLTQVILQDLIVRALPIPPPLKENKIISFMIMYITMSNLRKNLPSKENKLHPIKIYL